MSPGSKAGPPHAPMPSAGAAASILSWYARSPGRTCATSSISGSLTRRVKEGARQTHPRFVHLPLQCRGPWASGIDAIDLVKQPGGVCHQHDVGKARLAQARLQDGSPDGFSSMTRILSAASGGRGVTGWRGGARFVHAMVGCAVHTVIGLRCVHTMACYAHDDAAPQHRTQCPTIGPRQWLRWWPRCPRSPSPATTARRRCRGRAQLRSP